MGERIVITGGSGLIGRALAADMVAAGYDVIILSRNPETAELVPGGVRLARWDGRTAQGWGILVDDGCAIVNLAGAGIAQERWTKARKSAILYSRLEAGYAVSEAIRQAAAKPRVLVQASATGYYGPDGSAEKGETAPPGSDFLAGICVAWEESTATVEELGVRRSIIRTGLVLSHEGGALPRLVTPFRFFVGGRLGNGRHWVPWIHIRDEVRAIRFLIENDHASGPYNLVSPAPVTNAAMAHELGSVLYRPSFVPVPAAALRLALGEMAGVLLTGQHALPERLVAASFTFDFPELRPALVDLVGHPSRRA